MERRTHAIHICPISKLWLWSSAISSCEDLPPPKSTCLNVVMVWDLTGTDHLHKTSLHNPSFFINRKKWVYHSRVKLSAWRPGAVLLPHYFMKSSLTLGSDTYRLPTQWEFWGNFFMGSCTFRLPVLAQFKPSDSVEYKLKIEGVVIASA